MLKKYYLKICIYFFSLSLIIFLIYSPHFPIDILDGLLLFAVIFLIDISLKNRCSIKNQKSFIKKIFDNSPDVVFLIDKNHRFIDSNSIFLDMLKLGDKKSLIGRTYYDFIDPIIADELRDADNRVFEQKCCIRCIERVNIDNKNRIFDVRKIPFIADGDIEGVITFARDITQEKLLEQHLKEQQLWMNSFFENVNSIAYIKDKDGRILFANRQFEDFMHLKSEDIIGKPLSIADDDIESMDVDVIENKKIISIEKELLTAEGKKWMEFRKSPAFDESGNYLGMTVLVQDISKIKTVEKYLIQARQDTILANKLKSELIANISHEIRTPICGIIGFLDLLNLSVKNEKSKKFLSNAMKSSQHLLTLINSLLDFSNIEKDSVELSCSYFCLKELFYASLEDIKNNKNDKGLNIEFYFDEKIPAYLYGDSLKLQQVFNNILDNAVKFTDSGKINFICKMLEDNDYYSKIYFEITDTGIGVDENIQNNIFDSFMQADSSITKKYEGLGLGLTICKHFLKLMGSEIFIESTKGVGTKVFFEVVLKKRAIITGIHQTCSNIV